MQQIHIHVHVCIYTLHFQAYLLAVTKFCNFKKLVVSRRTGRVVSLLPPLVAGTKLLDDPPGTKDDDRGMKEASSVISTFWFSRRLREIRFFLLAVHCLALCVYSIYMKWAVETEKCSVLVQLIPHN